MDLDQLAVFVRVVDARGFAEAARRLGKPKSSVSRAVARLEAALGARLLHRTTRRLALTPAGATLYERVAPHVAALQLATRSLPESDRAPAGEVRITAPNDLGTAFLADLVARFRARYPAVHVEVHLTVRTVDLLAEGFDLALRAGAVSDPALVVRRLASLEAHFYAATEYLARRGTPRTPDELVAAHECVLFRSRAQPAAALKVHGPRGALALAPRPGVVCDDFGFVLGVVRAGGGVGLMPAFLAARDVAAGRMTRVLPEYAARGGALHVVSPSARDQPRRVAVFKDFLIKSLQTRPLGA